jgi:hypothetical protein
VITSTTNADELRANIAKFIRETDRHPKQVLRQQARLLFVAVARLTPPGKLAKGRQRVKSDINKAMRPFASLKAEAFASPKLKAWLTRLKATRNEIQKRKFLENVYGAAAKLVPFNSKLHQEARTKRGQVNHWRPVFVTSSPPFNAYVRKVQGRVGRARGGWARAVATLGGSMPSWASRWARVGTYVDRLDAVGPAYLEGENKSEWASSGADDRVVSSAVSFRAKAVLDSIVHAVKSSAERSFR